MDNIFRIECVDFCPVMAKGFDNQECQCSQAMERNSIKLHDQCYGDRSG